MTEVARLQAERLPGGPPIDYSQFPDLVISFGELTITKGYVQRALLEDALVSIKHGPAILATLGVLLQTTGGVLSLIWS